MFSGIIFTKEHHVFDRKHRHSNAWFLVGHSSATIPYPIKGFRPMRHHLCSLFIISLLLVALLVVTNTHHIQADTTPQRRSSQNKTQPTKRSQRPKNPAMTPVEDVEGLPRVLLIGDSISIGYTVPARDALRGKANVHRPLTNCGPTTRGLEGLSQWLGETDWDVIHFNWGLHDLKYLGPNDENLQDPKDPKNHQQVPPKEYEQNLQQLVSQLEKTGAILIWRNTTPVPAGSKGRVEGDAAAYNDIAKQIMAEHGIEIHDMYGLVKPQMATLMLPNGNVHFTKEGSEKLGNDVADVIMKALQKKAKGT